MSEQFTPGPWVAQAKPYADVSEGTHYIRCAVGVLGYWRGHKRHHDDSHWVLTEADAHLIAAAPDLLAACIEVHKGGNGGSRLSRKASDMVRAAISKATGEKS